MDKYQVSGREMLGGPRESVKTQSHLLIPVRFEGPLGRLHPPRPLSPQVLLAEGLLLGLTFGG